jgi:hypothetical protein
VQPIGQAIGLAIASAIGQGTAVAIVPVIAAVTGRARRIVPRLAGIAPRGAVQIAPRAVAEIGPRPPIAAAVLREAVAVVAVQ